ncbi:N-acetylmuramoyl-L-alanine amidase family protein [Thalassobellus citreus]|uniref:N-acetylmuramoyl-L-alanine amidase family protein n=1 Tax=Thalassobellus citreus TaxID=3367752 RepID=UPI0037884764
MKTNSILLFVCFIIVLTFSSFIDDEQDVNRDKFIVVLDAGHGGRDPGNLGNGYKEKNIALKVVLAVGKELEKNPNIKVVYTRKTDVAVDLKERPKIANKAKADLFVSIHCNSHHTQAHGTETFVLGVANTKRNFEIAKKENSVILLENDYEKKYEGFNPNSPETTIGLTLMQEEYTDQSIQLASIIEKNFTKGPKRYSRGVKQASLWVIHQTAMPSVLIELGFLTNNKEGVYLNSKKGQQEISKSVVKSILEYKASLDNNIGDFVDESDDVNLEPVIENESVYNDITFKIQIAASSKKLETKPYNFKGLSNVSRVKEGNLYKYFYGSTSNYNETKKLASDAKRKGYATSFIVAFKDDKKISLTEALKTTSN